MKRSATIVALCAAAAAVPLGTVLIKKMAAAPSTTAPAASQPTTRNAAKDIIITARMASAGAKVNGKAAGAFVFSREDPFVLRRGNQYRLIITPVVHLE